MPRTTLRSAATGQLEPMPKPSGAKLCKRVGHVELYQHGPNRFTVVYGLQIKRGLTYNSAATEFGACIMHEVACEGELNNA